MLRISSRTLAKISKGEKLADSVMSKLCSYFSCGKDDLCRLLERIARLGVLAMVQPIFLDYDMYAVESRCGRELASTSYAFETLRRLGGHVSYGTDAPVESCNPFPNLYSAVTRKNKDGYPK